MLVQKYFSFRFFSVYKITYARDLGVLTDSDLE